MPNITTQKLRATDRSWLVTTNGVENMRTIAILTASIKAYLEKGGAAAAGDVVPAGTLVDANGNFVSPSLLTGSTPAYGSAAKENQLIGITYNDIVYDPSDTNGSAVALLTEGTISAGDLPKPPGSGQFPYMTLAEAMRTHNDRNITNLIFI